jgi:hypothetical protein
MVEATRDFVVIVAEAVTHEHGLGTRAVLEVPAMHEPATATRMVEIAALGERLSALRLCDAEALTTIRRSLEQHGQLAALTLFAEPGGLEIIDGFKRLRPERRPSGRLSGSFDPHGLPTASVAPDQLQPAEGRGSIIPPFRLRPLRQQ